MQLNDQTILELYFQLNRNSFNRKWATFRKGASLITFNVNATVDWDRKEIDTLWAYTRFREYKMKQLRMNYLDPHKYALTKRRLLRKLKSGSTYFTLGFAFGTGRKDDLEKTGECLSAIAFYVQKIRGQLHGRVQVFWRMTEVTRRWVADLRMIDEIIQELFTANKIHLDKVILNMGGCFVSNFNWLIWQHMYPGAKKEPNAPAFFKYIKKEKGLDLQTIKYKTLRRTYQKYREIKDAGLPGLFPP